MPPAAPQGPCPDDDRLAALAEFAAGAGHEINNPLATISGRVQLLLRDEADPERRRSLLSIGGQAERIRDMIGDLMLFARPPAPRPEVLDLSRVLGEAVGGLHDRAAARGCRLQVRAEERVPVWADREQLLIVVDALVANSLEAMPEGGPVNLSSRRGEEADGRWGILAVRDEGTGFDETSRRHLFDPFYSGRQAGRGLGFGLCKCWRIVSNHGGRIEVDSAPGGPTTFTVGWPADPPSPPRGRGPSV